MHPKTNVCVCSRYYILLKKKKKKSHKMEQHQFKGYLAYAFVTKY